MALVPRAANFSHLRSAPLPQLERVRRGFRYATPQKNGLVNHGSNRCNCAEQSAGGDAHFLAHQDRRDDIGRNRRRLGDDDAALGLPRRHGVVSPAARGSGGATDCREEISPVPLLGDDCCLHHIRHHHGGFRRPLARHRLCRRRVDLARLRRRRARALALVARHRFGRHRQHAESGGVLLGRHHVFADARHRARRLDRRIRPGLATNTARWFSPPLWRSSPPLTIGRMRRACCCSGSRSS